MSSPSETAIHLVLRIKGKYRHGDSADEEDAALIDAALAEARREVVEFAEGGRFLHDEAPAAIMAREFGKAARDRFALSRIAKMQAAPK